LHTITQNTAGEIWMDCHDGIVQMHVSERNYEVEFLELEDDYDPLNGYYIGTLDLR
jgi:hypothetical protein